jgi:hypothetical protein
MATRSIIINGINKGELTLPDGTSEEVWAAQFLNYKKGSNMVKVRTMYNFNIEFKLKFVAENIDMGISALTPPAGYSSMRDFAKTQLSPIYQDMLDYSYPEALAKIAAKQIECDSNEDWAPIITRARLEAAKIEILTMLGSL